MRALRKHCHTQWILVCVERWLKAPMQSTDGLIERNRGNPQGGVITSRTQSLTLTGIRWGMGGMWSWSRGFGCGVHQRN
jgi:hypothetical protein